MNAFLHSEIFGTHDYLEYFGEFEAIFEKTLGRESVRAQRGGQFDGEKPRVENLVTLSL
jgi:hypothetical protein